MLQTVRLSDRERAEIGALLADIASDLENRDEGTFLGRVALLSHELPRSVREVFYDFGIREHVPALLITNNPVGAADIGPTPGAHWRPGEDRPLNVAQQLHGLYAALLGEPFGFDTQQHGRVFNDLVSHPAAPDNSSSGGGRIGLHTEDVSATQPFMPDYLGLMCLRNNQHAVTTFAALRDDDLSVDVRRTLLQRAFPFRNDTRRPVLFGCPNRPYLRYSPIERAQCDEEMVAAFDGISAALHRNLHEITLQPGDGLYLNNLVAVHGRSPFSPEFGANGRWFSRLCILRDLRRIRRFTSSPESRVMRGEAVQGQHMD